VYTRVLRCVQALTTQEFNHLVRQSYGDQLGLEISDDEDVSRSHSRHSSYEPLVTGGNGVENKVGRTSDFLKFS
jgi:hypothetical protein